MEFSPIENCAKPKSSFIHVYGKLSNSNDYSDLVINVDKINFIRELPDNKTYISFSDNGVTVDHDYHDIIESFLDQVNLLFHLNKE